MQRLDLLRQLAPLLRDNDLAVVALGGTTDEWNHVRPSQANFFSVCMGANLSIAMGLAFALPHRKVVLLDTDGCQLMTLGSLCTLANHPPKNLRVFVMDNEAYAGTGGQPTATSGKPDLAALARAAGIEQAVTVTSLDGFRETSERAMSEEELSYSVAKVELVTGHRFSRGFDHVEAKYRFVRYIEESEGMEILAKR